MLVANIFFMAIDRPVTGKRQRAHARLMEAALDLFERQGFDSTTVTPIAAAGGVTEMTSFRHFPTKEHLLLDDPYDPLIAAAVADRPRDLPPVTRAVRGLRGAWNDIPPPAEEAVQRRVRIAAQTPSLRAGMARNNARTEQPGRLRTAHPDLVGSAAARPLTRDVIRYS